MSEAVYFICVVVLAILFAGEPSLMDAIVNYLNSAGCRP